MTHAGHIALHITSMLVVIIGLTTLNGNINDTHLTTSHSAKTSQSILHVIEGGIKDTSSTISDLMTEKTGTILAVLKDIKEDNEILHHMADNQQILHNEAHMLTLTCTKTSKKTMKCVADNPHETTNPQETPDQQ